MTLIVFSNLTKILRLVGKEENGWVRVKRFNSEEEVGHLHFI